MNPDDEHDRESPDGIDTDESTADGIEAVETLAVGSPYKVLGEVADAGGIGVLGRATAASGGGHGVKGYTGSAGDLDSGTYPAGVFGLADGAGGAPRGVRGRTDAGYTGTVGVQGETTYDGNVQTYGVKGTTAAAGDNSGDLHPAGVYGEATATGADSPPAEGTYGVYGKTHSWDGESAGVRAEAGESNSDGLQAVADNLGGTGVRATATGDDQDGVYGRAEGASTAYGVHGVSTSPDAGAAGVRGLATDSSGEVYGVKGSTNSGDGYGLYSEDDAKVAGALDVGHVGASVYLGFNQSVAGDGSDVRVQFGSTVADDRNEWSTSNPNYAFVCDSAGAYHVEVGIDYNDPFPPNTLLDAGVTVDDGGGPVSHAVDTHHVPDSSSQSHTQFVSHSFGKTLRNRSAGDQIYVTVSQNSGSSVDLVGTRPRTYLTVSKVG